MTVQEFIATLEGEELAAAKACKSKHTSYQPDTKEFFCPRCKAPAGDFCVDEGPNMECALLHDDDILNCYGAGGKQCPSQYGTTGKAYAANLVKKQNLVACSHCKGKGYVPGPKK